MMEDLIKEIERLAPIEIKEHLSGIEVICKHNYGYLYGFGKTKEIAIQYLANNIIDFYTNRAKWLLDTVSELKWHKKDSSRLERLESSEEYLKKAISLANFVK